MATFIVIFVASICLVLLLAPLCLHYLGENHDLRLRLRSVQADMADTLRQTDKFRLAAQNASDGLLLQDMKGNVIWCNAAYLRIMGVDEDVVLGRNPLEWVMTEDETPTKQEISAFQYYPDDPSFERLQTFRNRKGDGTHFWNQISVSFRKGSDGCDYAILVCRDISEQMEQAQHLQTVSKQLEHQASHDSLTQVPNRAAFLSFVDKAIARGATNTLGLLQVDLDHFKDVNDTYGHAAGDIVLQHTAKAIQSGIRDTDLVARIGGDEFVVVCTQSPDLEHLGAVAKRLQLAIAEEVRVGDSILNVEASIGAAQSRGATCNAASLLTRADFALYEAKHKGRNTIALYDEDLHKRHTAEIASGRALVDAIDTGSMEHAFQPLFDLENGEVIGFETLVRWTHPDDGPLLPDEFLPIVESLGLMGALDLLSMRAALQKKGELDELGYNGIGITFNASPRLLDHPDFINRLVWMVESSGIRRGDITIEILENTEFGDHASTTSHAAMIRDLQRAGFQVHLDDFGVGFAGLSHLASLDITGVKIDRSLITGMMTDDVSFKVVRKIIELARDLGLSVIAEGVEDEVTADTLSSMGCKTIQGYWIAPPLPQSEVTDWLANFRRPDIEMGA